MLEVVEHQEQAEVLQMVRDDIEGVRTVAPYQAQGAPEGGEDVGRVDHGGQYDLHHPVRIVRGEHI